MAQPPTDPSLSAPPGRGVSWWSLLLGLTLPLVTGGLRAAEIRVISATASPPAESRVLVIGAADPSETLLLAQESDAVLRIPLPPAPPTAPQFIRCSAASPNRLFLSDFQREIAVASEASGVPEALIRAIIHAESAFRPTAVSHKNAQGLMQLIPATAARFGVEDVFDPASNILGGATYLAWLLRRFDGNLALAAAGYNAGEGRVDQYDGIPPFAETQHYVRRVQSLFDAYNRALHGRITLTLAASPRAASC